MITDDLHGSARIFHIIIIINSSSKKEGEKIIFISSVYEGISYYQDVFILLSGGYYNNVYTENTRNIKETIRLGKPISDHCLLFSPRKKSQPFERALNQGSQSGLVSGYPIRILSGQGGIRLVFAIRIIIRIVNLIIEKSIKNNFSKEICVLYLKQLLI